jgi:hypothetical protein
MDQFIITVRNAAGGVSQVPTLAVDAADAETKIREHWAKADSQGMEILRVTFNRTMSL